MEHFFKGVDGVTDTVPGYANGLTPDPTYAQVYTDTTGYAETVEVSYDDTRVSLRELAEYFFCIIDPLSLNRQGGDLGTRYRTGVYYESESDLWTLGEVFDAVGARLGGGVVTELRPLECFYPAEEYHRDYLDKNAGGYCHVPLKAFRYLRLYQDLKLLLGGDGDTVARMAQACALIQERMRFFWTGFYRVDGDTLLLGPFQGPSACLRIAFGRGVCGSAWQQRRTLVVPDVEEFPGHIACSALSRSEIVVPVYDGGGDVTAVLDIDSTEKGTFDATDAQWLEKIVTLI